MKAQPIKIRKKPIVLEAMQYKAPDASTSGNIKDLQAWGAPVQMLSGELVVITLESGKEGQAKHVVEPNAYVVKGVQGEFYAIREDIFDTTYDIVTDE